MKTEQDDKLLHAHIAHYTALAATSCEPHVRKWMTDSLTNFVITSIAKYERGQREHGGNLCDRNLKLERSMEITDLFWYNEAEDMPKK